jgi:hypothetical protein
MPQVDIVSLPIVIGDIEIEHDINYNNVKNTSIIINLIIIISNYLYHLRASRKL